MRTDPNYHFKWRQLNKLKIAGYSRSYNQKLKDDAFAAYGGAICSCCGELEKAFLTIDHINGNGKAHRETFDGPIYRVLKKENYPEGYQVLCMNCNFAKGVHGGCPHEALAGNLVTVNSGG